MQAEALRWCREVAGRRSCRPLDGASPLSVFDAVEAEALIPLPRTEFVLADWSTGKVGPDIHLLTELIPMFRHVSAVISEWRSYRRCRVRRLGRRSGSVGVGGCGGGVAGGDGLEVGALSAA